MSVKVKIELNKEGIVALLQSPEIEEDLARRGENIANAAGPEDFDSRTWIGFDRARCSVFPISNEGRKQESENKVLTRSLDAARH